MRNPAAKIFTAIFLLVASSAALAHPGHSVSGFAAGLLHSFSGAAPAAYVLGFLAATATLYISGIAADVATRKRYVLLSSLLGSAIAICGAFLLATT